VALAATMSSEHHGTGPASYARRAPASGWRSSCNHCECPGIHITKETIMSQKTDPTGARRRDGQMRGCSALSVFVVLAVLAGVVDDAWASVTIRGVAHPKYLISSVPTMTPC
jgi:hypothetical protein